ncbi:hypothetical protein C8Q75DRAFT_724994 [Abortiporus biennis]|nr:hypothetical protein C8Q75DRAFT_724994 [Abortiporus biennis]
MHLFLLYLFIYLVFNLSRPLGVLAVLVNVTVDDSGTDPTTGVPIVYAPPDAWNLGQTCAACTAHVDSSIAFDHTWHDVSYNPSVDPTVVPTASLQFNGSAIYVFCIIAHTSVSPDGNSNMTFFIDGQVVNTFLQTPNNDTSLTYNFPVYVNTSLQTGIHTFMLQTGGLGSLKSLTLLDYIVYS